MLIRLLIKKPKCSHVVEIVGCELFVDRHTFADQSVSVTIAWAAVCWSTKSLHSVERPYSMLYGIDDEDDPVERLEERT